MSFEHVKPNVEVIEQGLNVPWSICFIEEDYFLFTERPGNLCLKEGGKMRRILSLNVEARKGDEGGLLGTTISPTFKKDDLIYLYYTYRNDGVWNRVSSFEFRNGDPSNEEIVLDKIPGGRVHNGGRIRFGPDQKLYVTTGETWKSHLAQDLNSLGGKILRLNQDGTVPDDNPFKNSFVYSYGNRNAQGITWHPKSRCLYASEHGPSGENGWYAHDEVNLITPGGNYGWPKVIGYSDEPDLISPIYQTGDDTWAPSGASFCSGRVYPEWRNALLVACLRGRSLKAIHLNEDGESIMQIESYYDGVLGRLRDVVESPGGFLYICTSNKDGRGSPRKGDDYILKITPE